MQVRIQMVVYIFPSIPRRLWSCQFFLYKVIIVYDVLWDHYELYLVVFMFWHEFLIYKFLMSMDRYLDPGVDMELLQWSLEVVRSELGVGTDPYCMRFFLPIWVALSTSRSSVLLFCRPCRSRRLYNLGGTYYSG